MLEHIRVSKDSNFDPIDIQERTTKVFKSNVRKVADAIRDDMREEYAKMVHRTEYGNYSQVDPRGPASLGTSAIVVREQNGDYYVGPKLGGIRQSKGVVSYDEIFSYITEGTGDKGTGVGRGWWFKLPDAGGRFGASDTGWWFTSGQAAKPFIDNVYAKQKSGELGIKVDKYVRIPVYQEAGR